MKEKFVTGRKRTENIFEKKGPGTMQICIITGEPSKDLREIRKHFMHVDQAKCMFIFKMREVEETIIVLVSVYPEAIILFDGPEDKIKPVLEEFKPVGHHPLVRAHSFHPNNSVNDFERINAIVRGQPFPPKNMAVLQMDDPIKRQ